MPKKVLIALPPAMLEQVDYIAQCEHRTRSDLIREALRRYLDNFRKAHGQTGVMSVVAATSQPPQTPRAVTILAETETEQPPQREPVRSFWTKDPALS